MEYTEKDLLRILHDGTVDVECEECGHYATVEPDGDYDCPECEEGRLVSPLVKLGLI